MSRPLDGGHVLTVRDGDRHAAAVSFCHRMDKCVGGGGVQRGHRALSEGERLPAGGLAGRFPTMY